MMGKKLFIFVFLLMSVWQGYAQENTAKLRSAVVEIRTVSTDHTELGSGFLVAKVKGLLYIVTAKHVTLDQDMVEVTLEGQDKPHSAEVIFKDDRLDLAVLTLNAADFAFQPISYAVNADGGDKVFTMGANQDKLPLSNNGAAMLMSVTGESVKANLAAQKGDSGSPLFSSNVLIGMLYEAPGTSIPIKRIKLTLEDNDIPWQLEETALVHSIAEVKKIEPGKLIIIKDFSLGYDDGYPAEIRALNDGNFNTSWTCKQAGYHQIEISTAVPYFIKSIQLFYPDSHLEDFPNMDVRFISNNKQYSFQSKLSKTLIREGNGQWVQFLLPDFLLENHITIRFKVKKDTKENPEPVLFYEIRLTGLSN